MTREQVDALIAVDDASAAAGGMARLFAAGPTAGAAAFVVSRFEKIAPALSLNPLRVAILRSFTVEPLVSALRARCYLAGIDATLQLGDYNVFAQELLDPSSRLYAFRPDLVIVAALTRDFAPALWTGAGNQHAEAAAAARRLRSWLEAFRQTSEASVIVQSFEQPAYAAGGILDARSGDGQRQAIETLNQAALTATRELRSVYLLDYDALVARHGRLAWADPHKDFAMRVPIRSEAYGWLADEYMRFVHPLTGRVCKAIAVDLDNTLWGGVIGEDGASGLQLGAEYPGPAFSAVQQHLKALAARGILLTVCSKNNPDEAMAVLRDHPDMVLRPGDFAAFRINWEDKVANLRSLAAELNIGIDSFAFVDDNPAERDWVRAQLPEVTVVDLPTDAVLYADTLRRQPAFERLSLSAEDQARTAQYQAERLRADVESSSASIDDFLRSLEMTAAIDDLAPSTLARVAQLTQKTNQFNTTTRRYTEEQVSRFAGEPGAIVRTIRVGDRYGDSGLVGVLMARVANSRCEIDTLLLSCRVIGRGVESVMLADLGGRARRLGASVLAGRFIPTPKNEPAREVYSRHGFSRAAADADGSVWEFDLDRAELAPPDFIKVTIPT